MPLERVLRNLKNILMKPIITQLPPETRSLLFKTKLPKRETKQRPMLMANQMSTTLLQKNKEHLLMVHVLEYVSVHSVSLLEELPVLLAMELLQVFLNPNWQTSGIRMKN